MRRPPIHVALLLSVLLALPNVVVLQAAVAAVGNTMEFTNGDATFNVDTALVFPGGAPASGHAVLVYVKIGSSSTTISLDGAPSAVTAVHDRSVNGTNTQYIFCYVGDGADNSVTMNLSAGSNTQVAAKVFSGTDGCTETGTSSHNTTSATQTHELTTDITVAAGSLVFGGFTCTDSACTGSAGTGVTPVGNAGGMIGSLALGGYRIEAGAGTYDLPFTTTVNRAAVIAAVGIAAAAAAAAPTCVIGAGIICDVDR